MIASRLGNLASAAVVLMSTLTIHADYDPLAVPASVEIQTLNLEVADPLRSRTIPLHVYLLTCEASSPNAEAESVPAPVILFSHGLGGSNQNNPYLGEHWAARGYVVVFLQHPGSDETVWQDVPPLQRQAAMMQAANLENAILRFGDVPRVIDQLTTWNADPESPLHGRLDLRHLGMSGHSFGALTTQAVSGQRTTGGGDRWLEPRITAAVMMSPSAPRRGSPSHAFARVSIPWLLMTGTHDNSIFGGGDVASRLAVYPALPPGKKYQVVLDQAEHSAFNQGPLPGDTLARNPNHHRVILVLSTAFWDAYLGHDPAAQAWLNGPGPRQVLEPDDQWEQK